MSILLLILKIIGIILLSVLGVLLLAVMLILFVPLRYKAEARVGELKKTVPYAAVQVTWLFRLIKLVVTMNGKSVDLSFRLAWIRKGKKASRDREDAKETEEPAEPVKTEKPEEPAKPAKAEETIKPADKKKIPEKKPDRQKKAGKNPKGPSVTQRIEGFTQKILSLPEKIMDLLLTVNEAIGGKTEKLGQMAERASDRIEDTVKKAERFMAEPTPSYMRWLLRRLCRMLRHFRIRNIKGYLHYGTGTPHMTAYAGGLISLILPASAQDFTLDPDFNNTVLHTEMTLNGHVRVCHAAALLIRMALKRDTWTLLKRIRKAGRKGGK